MAEFKVSIIGLKEFEKAIKRNPKKASDEFKNFFQRAEAKLKSTIRNNPWKINGSPGGVPVLTGNLRDAGLGAGRTPRAETKIRKRDGKGHIYERKPGFLRIFPTASYAKFVHEGTRRMRPRPWLDHALKSNMKEIRILEKVLLNNIVKDLAR